MAALTKDKGRAAHDLGPDGFIGADVDVIYQGSAVGNNSGYGRALVAADAFLGFNLFNQVDNAAGAQGDKTVKLSTRGVLKRVTVTGASAVTDIGSKVYLSSDNDLTLTSTSNTEIGKVVGFHAEDSTFDVYYEGAYYNRD